MKMLLKTLRYILFILIVSDNFGTLMGVPMTESECVVHPIPLDVLQQLIEIANATIGHSGRSTVHLSDSMEAHGVRTDLKEQTTPDRILEAVLQQQEDMKQMKQDMKQMQQKLSQHETPLVSSGQMLTEDQKQCMFGIIPERPRDCFDLLQLGKNESGIYTIYPQKCGTSAGCGVLDEGIRVSCDMDNGEGGWTIVLLRRPIERGQIDFNQRWRAYRTGFGDPETEYWIGNDALHLLTNERFQILHVDMTDWDEESRYAEYNYFIVGDADTEFRLNLDRYSGNAGDSLRKYDGMSFSTPDRDNDKTGTHCAANYKSGFWFNDCSILASPTNELKTKKQTSHGINWVGFHSDRTTLRDISFKVKPTCPGR